MAAQSVVRYLFAEHWIRYDRNQVLNDLVEAKAAVLALKAIPYQPDWVLALLIQAISSASKARAVWPFPSRNGCMAAEW